MEQNIAHKIVFWGTEDFIKKGSLSQVIISGEKIRYKRCISRIMLNLLPIHRIKNKGT